jgi:hypothetical protein
MDNGNQETVHACENLGERVCVRLERRGELPGVLPEAYTPPST